MAKIKIKFSNLLADEISKEVYLDLKNKESLSPQELLSMIKEQTWGDKIVENDHIKTSIVLIIDDKVIQFANPPDIEITSNSKISCHVMFAGGL